MRVLVVFLFLSLAAAECNRTRILDCVAAHFDMDGNGLVNVTEINHFMLYQPCGRDTLIVTGETIMEYCDKDGDMELGETDYDAPGSCAAVEGIQRVLCRKCDKCDAYKSMT